MSAGDLWLLVTVASLVLLAGAFSAADAALGSFSQARAGELAAEERAGSKRLLHLLEDAPRYLNTALLLRLACEVTAIVLATLLVRERFQESWAVTVMVTVAVMLVLSFVVIGVAPRTLGRQHSESVALFSAGPLTWVTRVLGPVPRVLILLGNAITPGKGFTDGPFSTETELRELVDLAEASSLIESEERRMIHSVFDLSDTTAREVMVPRGDVVFVERHKNLRQTLSLFLRSGFSRVPVIEDNLDHVVGVAYLKDLVRRDFDEPDAEFTERIESHMREPYWVPVLALPRRRPRRAVRLRRRGGGRRLRRRPDGQAPRAGPDPRLHGRGARPALRRRVRRRTPQQDRHRAHHPGRARRGGGRG